MRLEIQIGYIFLAALKLETEGHFVFYVERLWSRKESTSGKSSNETALPRLHYFRCLLNRRGVQAAPVENFYARSAPTGAGSCYVQ